MNIVRHYPEAVARWIQEHGHQAEIAAACEDEGAGSGGDDEVGDVEQPDFCICGRCDKLLEMDGANVTNAERREARKCRMHQSITSCKRHLHFATRLTCCCRAACSSFVQ